MRVSRGPEFSVQLISLCQGIVLPFFVWLQSHPTRWSEKLLELCAGPWLQCFFSQHEIPGGYFNSLGSVVSSSVIVKGKLKFLILIPGPGSWFIKPDNLSLLPRTYMVEKTDPCKLSSDLCVHAHINTWTHSKCKINPNLQTAGCSVPCLSS